ncbi:MAG: hypothetical protein IJ599_00315, partial [Alphaproteobacteria bacterium]|nr:hypothetical protein [Alphaproteobacteria bacterium]
MVGGDIAVNGGSTVISGTLSGTIRDVAVTGEGCLHIGRYDAVRTGKYSADGGTIYTSDMKKL